MWIRHWICCASVFLCVFPVFGQVISNEFIDRTYPDFLPSAIKDAGIKTITIREMHKPSSRQIFDQGKRFTYFFDHEGRMIGYRKTYPSYGGRIDTNSFSRIFVGDHVAQEIEKLGTYQRKKTFKPIDSLGVQQTVSVKRGTTDWQVITEEEVRIKPIEKGRVIFLSGVDLEPYQRTIEKADDDGNILSGEIWNGSRLQSIELWEYENGKRVTHRFKDLVDDRIISHRLPGASEADRGEYCRDNDCLTWSILNHNIGLPKGWIFMNESTQDIDIWEFDYWYW